MSTAARRRLLAFDWPGNVRQLRNVIESMVVVDFDEVLDVDDLPAELAPGRRRGRCQRRGATAARLVGKPMEEIEALFIGETLKVTGGNREEAATCWASASGRCIGRLRNMDCRNAPKMQRARMQECK